MKSVINRALRTVSESCYIIFGVLNAVRPSRVDIAHLQFALDVIFHAVLT